MRTNLASLGVAAAAIAALALAQPALAGTASRGSQALHPSRATPSACSPSVDAVSYSDALDKRNAFGGEVSGLSSLAWDARQRAWVAALDNDGSTPEYLWSFRDLADPMVDHAPLVLKRPDGTPYDGTTADDEGLVVLPDGDYLVSSEVEPSIRVYGRDGVQLASLPIPDRFAVTGRTPAGEATRNATLEGLTITPDGRTVVAAMEGALSGDVSADGTDASAHRLLVYTQVRRDHYRLEKQIEYRTDPGMRVPEVAAYTNDAIVVEEAAWTPTTGNSVNLFAVTGISKAADVSGVADLSTSPGLAVKKTLLADLTDCPTLGATALETQTNPLMDNFEGMAVTGTLAGKHTYGLSMISDDNNSPVQHTRILDLAVELP